MIRLAATRIKRAVLQFSIILHINDTALEDYLSSSYNILLNYFVIFYYIFILKL